MNISSNSERSGGVVVFFVFCITLLSLVGHGAFYIILTFLFIVLFSLTTPSIKKYFDSTAKSILLFSFFYSMIPILRGGPVNTPFVIYSILTPIFYYMYGRHLIWSSRRTFDFTDAVFVIVVCYSFVVFNAMFSGGLFSVHGIADERILSFSEDAFMAATVVGLIISICFIGLPSALYLNTTFIRRIIFALLFVGAIMTTTYMLNRGGLAVAVTSLLVVTLYKFRNTKNSRIRIVLVILSVVALVLIALRLGLFSDAVEGYEMRNDVEDASGGRLERWGLALGRIFLYPFGWSNIDLRFVHNMWLDVDRTAGIIPFFIVLKITWDSFKNIKGLWKAKTTNNGILMMGAYSSLFTAMFFEPTINAISSVFFLFLLFCGCMKEYSIENGTYNKKLL